MCTIVLGPLQTEVVVKGGFLREEGLLHTVNVTQVLQVIQCCTGNGEEVPLVVTVHLEVKAVTDAEVVGNLPFGTNINIDNSILGIVLLLTATVLQNPVRITQRLIETGVANSGIELEGVHNIVAAVCCILTCIVTGKFQTV